jgi:alkylation response protein AidB-like acyl-CoA dehydrogenase
MVQHAAWLYDRRERDMANTVGRMVKVEGTELATVALDHAMQTFGATGMTAEHPLQLMAQHVRLLRVLEVPNELQQWFIARRILGLSGQSEETMRPL